MKAKQKLALAVLAGVSIGSAGAQAAHWYPVKTRPMYVFVGAGVTDLASGYPCWCRSEEHKGDPGKSARKPRHRQRPADIIHRPANRTQADQLTHIGRPQNSGR
jgi:hypothetical protein